MYQNIQTNIQKTIVLMLFTMLLRFRDRQTVVQTKLKQHDAITVFLLSAAHAGIEKDTTD